MEMVQNETFNRKTIVMDDKHFISCTAVECKLIYSGGESEATDSKFERCQVQLAGAAQRTAVLLTSIGVLPPPPGNPNLVLPSGKPQ
jgi:hypothetical protein